MLTAQSEQYCVEAFVGSTGRSRYSLVSTAAAVSIYSVIFPNPFIFLRCSRWTYTKPPCGDRVPPWSTVISKAGIVDCFPFAERF
jgi:hypothetical protein